MEICHRLHSAILLQAYPFLPFHHVPIAFMSLNEEYQMIIAFISCDINYVTRVACRPSYI